MSDPQKNPLGAPKLPSKGGTIEELVHQLGTLSAELAREAADTHSARNHRVSRMASIEAGMAAVRRQIAQLEETPAEREARLRERRTELAQERAEMDRSRLVSDHYRRWKLGQIDKALDQVEAAIRATHEEVSA